MRAKVRQVVGVMNGATKESAQYGASKPLAGARIAGCLHM